MRKTWTDQMIAADLIRLSGETMVMPSNQVLSEVGRGDLSNAISRRGGFQAWADRLGLKRGKSDSDTGWDGEIALTEKLRAEGFVPERITGVKSPFDLLIDSHVRIDVKSANYAEYGVCKGWFYRLGKYPQADIIAFYQLDTKDCYFIPWQFCPKSNVTISRSGGKYKEFKNRYDLVTQIRDARLAEIEKWPKPLKFKTETAEPEPEY